MKQVTTKTFKYTGFVIASLLIVIGFVTAKSYSQLLASTIFYPGLIFLGLMVFPRSSTTGPTISIQNLPRLHKRVETDEPPEKPVSATITDIDKRMFIKLIGATGLSFFLFSILGKRIDSLFLGGQARQPLLNTLTPENNQFGSAQSSSAVGYKIAEVDESAVSYYGFTNKDGAWLIMRENTDGGSFRYSKGTSDFPANWTNREKLSYDYYSNLF